MKKIRLEKGMSQGDICRSLGLDRAYISNVENGKQN
ncbi:MAG TPA: helix-turn-helix transcriptional regulator, partial [Candidatus Pacearchaeota archaeon]|nr:helix-turn-helix transcriptional regulator [Candidatus Pacearchaeota archaeon]